MEPLERLSNVENEVKKLRDELETLRNEITKVSTQNKEKIVEEKPTGDRYGIKVPLDEDLTDWLWVTDMASGNPQTYSSKEEAAKAGNVWGVHRVVKVI
jgi:hypothetical protein